MPGLQPSETQSRCPHCDSPVLADARFCNTCGHSTTTRRPPSDVSAPRFAPPITPTGIESAGRGVRCSSFLLDIAAMISPALPLAITAGLLGRAEVIYIVVPVAFVAVWAWLQLRQALTGNTFGKSMMGLRTVRATDHRPPGLGPVLTRSLIFVATGGLAALPVVLRATPCDGLHDRVSGLTVIDVTAGANPLGPRETAALRRTAQRGLNQVRSPIPHSRQR